MQRNNVADTGHKNNPKEGDNDRNKRDIKQAQQANFDILKLSCRLREINYRVSVIYFPEPRAESVV